MDYQITYSKRKTVGIKVRPDSSVVVSAPRGVSKRAIDEIILKHRGWIEKQIKKMKERPTALFNPTNEEISRLKEQTSKIVLPLVNTYSSLMGVEPTRVSFTSAKKVFGSCTSKKHLNFSFRLALFPVAAIEYVVVHELCHLKEMNHSKKFWAEVEKILPDYKERKKLLNK